MIHMEKIRFIQKEQQNFLRYELSEEEKISNTEMEMLKNNPIPNMLAVSGTKEDEKEVLFYEITGKVQLMQRFSAPFSGEELYKLLSSFCHAWLEADEYMLDKKHFILYPELLWMDQETMEISVMDLPVNTADDMELEFQRVLAGIFGSIQYYDEAMPGFFAVLFEYVNHQMPLTAKEFQEFLEQEYKNARGVILPVSDAPAAPEYISWEEKEIVEEDAAKELLQARFHVQNRDEVKFLEDTQETPAMTFAAGSSPKRPSGFFPGAAGKEKEKNTGKIFVPSPAGKKNAAAPDIAEGKKKKAAKAEKGKKDKKEGITIPAAKEKERKETKGLFHIFGKKKEKEEQKLQQPTEEKKLTPVEEVNHNRVSFQGNGNQNAYGNLYGNDQNVPQGKNGYYGNGMQDRGGFYGANGINGGFNGESGQNGNGSLYGNHGASNGNGSLYGNHGIPKGDAPSYGQWSLNSGNIGNLGGSISPLQTVAHGKEDRAEPVDLDATILSHGEVDLDATILNGSSAVIHIPVLRSRETGEIIKITGSGFLVGRHRMKNGVVVQLPNARQPDLVLPLQNISHSHASFFLKDGSWFIKDEGSLNGTFVNEENIGKGGERILAEGDVVRFASEAYEFLVMEE